MSEQSKHDAPTIITYKGFDKDLKCRGFQYEVGQTYTHEGPVDACSGGFHACEHPLNVFSYYAPASGSRFAVVEQSGDISRHDEDTKVASRTITIKAELDLPGLIRAAIEYTFSRANPVDPESPASATGYRGAASATGDRGAASATGDRGAASATGDQGAASATGDQGAASATGRYGAASATGDQGAASATGYRGAASATGDQGAASATGDRGAAISVGYKGRAMASDTGAIVLAYRNEDGEIIHIRASKVGDNGIKAGVWYSLDKDGEFFEVEG